MAFSETGPILATGTSSGIVELHRLVGFDRGDDPPELLFDAEGEPLPQPTEGNRLRGLFKATPPV
jgi:hypothetical protein